MGEELESNEKFSREIPANNQTVGDSAQIEIKSDETQVDSNVEKFVATGPTFEEDTEKEKLEAELSKPSSDIIPDKSDTEQNVVEADTADPLSPMKITEDKKSETIDKTSKDETTKKDTVPETVLDPEPAKAANGHIVQKVEDVSQE